VTTGQYRFTLRAYRALPVAPKLSTWLVELAVFDVLRIGLRACRAVAAGERLGGDRATVDRLMEQVEDGRGRDTVAVDAAVSAQRPVLNVLNVARFVHAAEDGQLTPATPSTRKAVVLPTPWTSCAFGTSQLVRRSWRAAAQEAAARCLATTTASQLGCYRRRERQDCK
jgi:hypothetical protein